MFGRKSAGEVRAFEFGCRAPTSGAQQAEHELARRNWLWNQFVEIEQEFRKRAKPFTSVPEDETVNLMVEQLEEIRTELRKHKKKAAFRDVQIQAASVKVKAVAAELGRVAAEQDAPPGEKGRKKVKPWLLWSEPETVRDLKEAAKKLWEGVRELKQVRREKRKKVIEANREHLDELEAWRNEQVKAAMAKSDLWWGNSDDARASYEVARKRAMKEGRELRFHRFKGTGKLAIRYQQGLPVAKAFGENTLLQIAPVDPQAWESTVRSQRRRLCRTTVRFRVGSNERHKPIWLTVPCYLDGRPRRMLPMDGVIRSAAIKSWKVGRSVVYRLLLTVVMPNSPVRESESGRVSVAGIDLGWRKRPAGLRVAYLHDGEASSEFVLPQRVVDCFLKVDDLKSIRKKAFNGMVDRLKGWIETAKVPGWLSEATTTLEKWESHNRLIRLFEQWRSQRFKGDGEVMEHFEAWAKKERHLYDWESNLRDQVIAHRREIYRIFASKLSRYQTVVMEDLDLRPLLRKPKAELGKETPDGKLRTIGALSILRLAIENVCRREGVDFILAPPEYSTQDCHACASREKFDQRGEIAHTCSACGTRWDQDFNAAVNLWKYARQPELAATA